MQGADRLRSSGLKSLANPWLAVGIVVGVILVCAWIGWAIHVAGDQGGREAVGVLIAWPAIAAVVALLLVPFIWAFRVIRAGRGGGEPRPEVNPEPSDVEVP